MAHFSQKHRKKSFSLGTPKSTALLLWVAEQKGFFSDHDVNLNIITVPHSRKAMELLLDGQLDSFMAMETNIAYLGYIKPKIPVKCLFSLEKRTSDCLLAGKKDISPESIIGQTIGFTPRTTSHTFLMRFLQHHNIHKHDIKLKPLSPQAIPSALMREEIYAASMWHPHTNNTVIAMEELGLNYTYFPNTGFHQSEVVFATTKTNIVKHQDFICRIVKALKDAEDFLNSDRERAYKILAECMNVSGPDYKTVLDCFETTLSPINDEYLTNVRTLGNWIRENDTQFISKDLPDYSEFIDNQLFLDNLTENN